MAAISTLAAGTFAAGALYIDGKLQLSKDLSSLRRVEQGERNFKTAGGLSLESNRYAESSLVAEGRASCFDLFEQSAKLHPKHEAIWSRESGYTWEQTYRSVCQFVHYFQSKGVRPGDFVALYLMNRPEFMFCWLGLLAIGASPALVNYNLSSRPLLHCIKISGSHLMIVDGEDSCVLRVQEVQRKLEDATMEVVFIGNDMKSIVSSMPATPPPRQLRQRRMPLGLLYTRLEKSGTTGLPKAFAVGIERAYYTASVRRKTFGQIPGPLGDRTYHCMPLYHGTGGFAALIDLMGGLSIALAPKFSASRFWLDCIQSESTISMYVGETARYLLAAPPSPNDRRHKIRLMWGNGLRSDVWKRFQQRFGVTEIGEFFASTEGMLTLVNHSRNDLSIGAVGHHGWLMRRKFSNIYISVRLDPVTGDVWRDPITGFADRTPLEEGGEVLIRVPNKRAWPGYWNATQEATDSKFLEHVLENGDLFYRTGDALRRTRDGYWYFMDRLGDTYRWKGENVSTTEVSQALGTLPIVADANVYGVSVPGHEGKTGCVAIFLSANMDESWTKTLASHARSMLPQHAVPVFVRVVKDPADMMTGNNKHLKVPFQSEGIDPALLGTKVRNGGAHAMYWLRPGADGFVRYTDNEWRALQDGRIRL